MDNDIFQEKKKKDRQITGPKVLLLDLTTHSEEFVCADKLFHSNGRTNTQQHCGIISDRCVKYMMHVSNKSPRLHRADLA